MNDYNLQIPKFLQEFHGKKAGLLDVIATYFAGLIAAGFILLMMPQSDPLWKRLLMMVLALDIGGGVVANFTKGTTEYHRKRPRLRKWFIAPLHLIHPVFLVIAYPGYKKGIILTSVLVISATYLVNSFTSIETQKVSASLLLIPIISTSILIFQGSLVLPFIIILFALKLILSYAVRWNS